jgi:hypothetical protein
MAKKPKKIHVEQLNDDKIEELNKELGDYVVKVAEEAAKKANKKLEKYGIKVKMQLVIDVAENFEDS